MSSEEIARDLVIAYLERFTLPSPDNDTPGAKKAGQWLGQLYATTLEKVRAANSVAPESPSPSS
jgi:hypothetical protein